MMTRYLTFFAPAAVMSAWATVMFHTVASGRINELLSPMFRNYVVVAGGFLLVFSVLYLLLFQPGAATAPAFARTGTLRQMGRWVMLLVPVVGAAIFAPRSFSSTTIINHGLNPSYQMPTWYADHNKVPQAVLDADPNQPAPVEVTDLIDLSKHMDQAKAFDGRKVRSVGHIVTQAGSAPKLVRLIMWCCAADAMPATVDLHGNIPSTWKGDDWLEVTGTARFATEKGKVAPVIDVDSIKATQEPDEPYLSP